MCDRVSVHFGPALSTGVDDVTDHDASFRTVVLVVEDDSAIADGLVAELTAHGYVAVLARTGRAAIAAVAARTPDAVLLDLGLPDLDGVHVCRAVRQELPSVPIVILTARDTEIDIVVGLDAGATDYVTKPFSTHVLLARLRAHLREQQWRRRRPAISCSTNCASMSTDFASTCRARRSLCVRRNSSLLIRMASSAGRVLSRSQLLDDVWDMSWETATNTLEVHVHALRQKLGTRGDGRPWITTVRSLGYRFEP